MALVDTLPQVKLDVPHEPSDFFMVRQLGWRELQDCRQAKARAFTVAAKEMGPELLEKLASIEAAAEGRGDGSADAGDVAELAAAKARVARDAQRDQFDRELLLSRSVMDWSYPEKFTKARLDGLDEQTADWLFGAIAELYAGAEDGADRGNASTPSTAS